MRAFISFLLGSLVGASAYGWCVNSRMGKIAREYEPILRSVLQEGNDRVVILKGLPLVEAGFLEQAKEAKIEEKGRGRWAGSCLCGGLVYHFYLESER